MTNLLKEQTWPSERASNCYPTLVQDLRAWVSDPPQPGKLCDACYLQGANFPGRGAGGFGRGRHAYAAWEGGRGRGGAGGGREEGGAGWVGGPCGAPTMPPGVVQRRMMTGIGMPVLPLVPGTCVLHIRAHTYTITQIITNTVLTCTHHLPRMY